jgi:two-component system invasion response regulator UvrY
MNERAIRVMLVDDHSVVRAGYRRLLEQTHIEVVAEAASGEEAYARIKELDVDVVVMDLAMAGMGGLEAIRRIVARAPKVRVLVFSMHTSAVFARNALKAGASGYVTKVSEPGVLVQAVREVYEGRVFLSRDIAHAAAVENLVGESDPMKVLSTREFEIFRKLASGASIKDIARALNLSQKTVANNYTQIKQKLDLKSDVELVRLALRYSIVDVD